mmetsp:Transcript_34633/g.42711  ORF Transcript_34633/g.42711 Transcript_34633/m.42711 type:complete len:122 (+) Transcript_34633:1079-1444(+)
MVIQGIYGIKDVDWRNPMTYLNQSLESNSDEEWLRLQDGIMLQSLSSISTERLATEIIENACLEQLGLLEKSFSQNVHYVSLSCSNEFRMIAKSFVEHEIRILHKVRNSIVRLRRILEKRR